MKKFIEKYQFDGLILLALAGLYLATRLINLNVMPMFTDEAIYMRWSQIGLNDSAWRFIPLTDGKPPLYHWLVMGIMATGIFSDPLIEGRIVSVVAGFASLVLIWILSYVLFSDRKLAHIAGLFYICSPFMLVYDRLAIVDSLLTTLSIAALILAVLLVKYLRLDAALLLGMTVGAGMLTKSSGLLFILLSPATILVSNWKKKQLVRNLLIWMGLLIIAFVLAQGIYNLLRLSQFYYRIEQKNYEFIIPISEFLRQPLRLIWGNAQSLLKWQIGYLTIPWVFLIFMAFFQVKKWRSHLLLLAYVIPTFLLIASFNKIIFPRFLVFSTPFLIVLAASGFTFVYSKIKQLPIKIGFLVLVLALPLQASISWITRPAQALIPQADKDQYYLGQPSGHGVEEIVAYISEIAETEKVFLGTDGTFGLTPDAFHVYLSQNPNVVIQGYYPVGKVPEEVILNSAEHPTYFVYYNVQEIPLQPNLELILEFKKETPSQTTFLRLFKVNPLSSNESE